MSRETAPAELVALMGEAVREERLKRKFLRRVQRAAIEWVVLNLPDDAKSRPNWIEILQLLGNNRSRPVSSADLALAGLELKLVTVPGKE